MRVKCSSFDAGNRNGGSRRSTGSAAKDGISNMKSTLAAQLAGGFVILIGVVGCGSAGNGRSESMARPADSTPVDGSSSLQTVATVGMVADLVRQVGGSRVDVVQLMGPGVDPHLYKPTRDDVLAIMRADLVFYAGLMLEGKMANVLEKVTRQKTVTAIAEQIDPQLLLSADQDHGSYDPHVWMDVAAWSGCVQVVADVLRSVDPSHAVEYQSRAAAFRETLAALHTYGQNSIGSVPERQRLLITSHDAFRYFGRAYGLEVHGVQGISTESEAGLVRINELVDLLVDRRVPAVFVESSVPRKSIEALMKGAESRGHAIVIGGELYSDAMGSADSYEGTYVGMLDHNITRVTRALGGKATDRGMLGKLSPAQEDG